MAAPKKNNPKAMDVTSPENTPPNTSSRPLIVGNRSTIPDPMVVPSSNDVPEPTTSPVLGEHVRRIEPVTPVKSDQESESTTDTLPIPPGGISTSVYSHDDHDEDKGGDAAVASPEKAPAAHTTDTEAPAKKASLDPETEAKTPSLVSKLDDKKSPADAENAEDEAEAKKAAEAEQAEHIEELIENKTYFLPIHQQQHRASWVLLLVLLVLAVAGGIGYMMTMAHR